MGGKGFPVGEKGEGLLLSRGGGIEGGIETSRFSLFIRKS